MVKVVGKTDEKEDGLGKEVNRLYDITKHIAKKRGTSFDCNTGYGSSFFCLNRKWSRIFHFLGLGSHISGCFENRSISIVGPEHFNTAVQLAEAYEKETGGEWTVKKMYDE